MFHSVLRRVAYLKHPPAHRTFAVAHRYSTTRARMSCLLVNQQSYISVFYRDICPNASWQTGSTENITHAHTLTLKKLRNCWKLAWVSPWLYFTTDSKVNYHCELILSIGAKYCNEPSVTEKLFECSLVLDLCDRIVKIRQSIKPLDDSLCWDKITILVGLFHPHPHTLSCLI